MDGPEYSDEEIKEMAELKTNWEISQGIKFSKRGIIEEIERRLKLELPEIDNSWK